MNIFAVDIDPIAAAHALCDAHVGKQMLEAGQIMHAALYRRGHVDARRPYNPGGRFAVWAAASRANYTWLARHGTALAAEFAFRYGHPHGGAVRVAHLAGHASLIPAGPLTPFARSEDVPVDGDAVTAYRAYYLTDKASIARWERGRPAPSWWTSNAIDVDARVEAW